MNSKAYRVIISAISYRLIRKQFPGLDKTRLRAVSVEIARNIHARMYGANVDGVASPIWRSDGDQYPRVDASEMLKDIDNGSGT